MFMKSHDSILTHYEECEQYFIIYLSGACNDFVIKVYIGLWKQDHIDV